MPAQPKIYLAAPLFNPAERAFNQALTEKVEKFCPVYLPQRDGGLAADLIAAGTPPAEAYSSVFKADIQALDACTHLLIVLDGRTVDEGACFELGLAFAKGKTCLGLKTDARTLLPAGNNPMLEGALKEIFPSQESLLHKLPTYLT